MSIDFSSAKVWQIGAGSGKSCADVFLKFGVGLIGSGDLGPWPGAYAKDKTTRYIRQLADEASEGDIILLRIGRSKIRAVGIIVSKYQYLEQFGDVDGWDLQHGRRIRWFELPTPYDFTKPVFGSSPTRFSGVGVTEVINYARRFVQSPPLDWQNAKLPELPEPELNLDPIPRRLEDIVGSARDLVQLYWNPQVFGDWPTEDELVAHFVIPLFRALGWPVEHIAIKWKYVDVVLFDRLPRLPENCRLIIEAKRFDTGFEDALKQAKRYLKSLGIERDILITDGIRYRLYAREKSFAPVAYANLSRLKAKASILFESIERK